MVELLLGYVPNKQSSGPGMGQKQEGHENCNNIFMPDVVGLTPLHVAASRDGSENVLDYFIPFRLFSETYSWFKEFKFKSYENRSQSSCRLIN